MSVKSAAAANERGFSMNTTSRQPAVFFGHGSPMNTLEHNRHTAAWARFGAATLRGDPTTKPRAILAISAHWYGNGSAVTAMPAPRTIHDFGGFPRALFEVEYPAVGAPALAQRIAELLAPVAVTQDQAWGLDHGTWSVLAHLAPAADIPVLQLQIDARQAPAFHYQLGQQLATLRDEGVMIMGSGDSVHNLRLVNWQDAATPFAWAERFDARVRACVEQADHAPLINYPTLDRDALLAVPTPEHYLPLLYVLGASLPGDRCDVITDGIELGSISMFAFALR
jgi:4,5-DOPA dioxygenase extradiol